MEATCCVQCRYSRASSENVTRGKESEAAGCSFQMSRCLCFGQISSILNGEPAGLLETCLLESECRDNRERERGGVSKNSNKTIIKTSACARTVPEGGKRQHHHRSVRKALKYVQMEPNMSTEASQDRKMIAVPYKRDRGSERNQDLPSRRFNPDTVRTTLSDGTGNPGGERNYIYLSIKIMDL